MELAAVFALGVCTGFLIWIAYSIDFIGSSLSTIPKNKGVSEKSKVVEDIARAFREDPIVFQDLSELKISTLKVNWQGKLVKVAWYSKAAGGGLWSLKVDSQSFPYSTPDAKYILKAAKKRARGLLNETINKLEKEMEENNKND